MSGSDHTNLLPTLTSLHTVWMRQHNHLTDQLKNLNPHWDDERLYQEARRIVGAQIQHITFAEFLPILVGMDNMNNYGLTLQTNGYYSDYNLNIDASVMNSFASAAGQFFYSIFTDYLAQYSKDGTRIARTKLSDNFFDPSGLYFQDRLDAYLRFLLKESVYEFDMHMSDDLRGLFLKGGDRVGLDLASLLIQLGRDTESPPTPSGEPSADSDDRRTSTTSPRTSAIPPLSTSFHACTDTSTTSIYSSSVWLRNPSKDP